MTDQDLAERFQAPDGWQWGHIHNAAGKDLRYGGSLPPEAPKAHIIYVEGLSEFAEKTFETARDFNAQGYSFWALDRQGQGLSGRLLSDQFHQHARPFEYDAADLAQLAREVVPQDGAPVFLLSHSTGGLISLIALHDYPNVFAGLAALAPPLSLKNPLIHGREERLAALMLPEHLRRHYVPAGHDWTPRTDPANKEKPSSFSSDPVRQNIHDYWMKSCPDLRIGSPTVGWVHEACRAIRKLHNPAYLAAIDKPVLIATAGNDILVDNRQAIRILSALRDTEYYHFNRAKHEMLMETDDIRAPLLAHIVSFIQRHTPAP